jgi:hypothetical protein
VMSTSTLLLLNRPPSRARSRAKLWDRAAHAMVPPADPIRQLCGRTTTGMPTAALPSGWTDDAPSGARPQPGHRARL